jgi:hypothetical protein
MQPPPKQQNKADQTVDQILAFKLVPIVGLRIHVFHSLMLC